MTINLEDYLISPEEAASFEAERGRRGIPTSAQVSRPRVKTQAFARISLDEIINRDNDWLFSERIRVWAWILIKTQHGAKSAKFTHQDAYELELGKNRRRMLRDFAKRGRIRLLEVGTRELWVSLIEPDPVAGQNDDGLLKNEV
jgi:hypothetical protein